MGLLVVAYRILAIAWMGNRELGMELAYNGFRNATNHILKCYRHMPQFPDSALPVLVVTYRVFQIKKGS